MTKSTVISIVYVAWIGALFYAAWSAGNALEERFAKIVKAAEITIQQEAK